MDADLHLPQLILSLYSPAGWCRVAGLLLVGITSLLLVGQSARSRHCQSTLPSGRGAPRKQEGGSKGEKSGERTLPSAHLHLLSFFCMSTFLAQRVQLMGQPRGGIAHVEFFLQRVPLLWGKKAYPLSACDLNNSSIVFRSTLGGLRRSALSGDCQFALGCHITSCHCLERQEYKKVEVEGRTWVSTPTWCTFAYLVLLFHF